MLATARILLVIASVPLLSSADDWPQWRGPKRTGYAAADAAKLEKLPAAPKVVWKVDVGGGFSGPVVSGKRLIYLDENGASEVAHAVEATTGRELWKVEYAAMFRDEWGSGPRATPMVDGDRVYVQACNGEFRCLNLTDGQVIWGTSFEKDFGVKFLGSKANEGTASRRGNNGSGVIEGNRLVLPVGNPKGAALVCFDKLTGKVLWKSGEDEAAYSSLMIGTLAGTKQVVAYMGDGLLGADLETGKVLWRVPLKTNAKRHAATPVIWDDYVAVNSHTFGMACFKIAGDSGGMQASQAWVNKGAKINLATPVLLDGHLYSQGASRDYICVDAKTGESKWTQSGFGAGRRDYASTIAVGNNLLVLTEEGQLLLLKPTPEKYTEIGRLQVCGNTWSFPAYAEGKLYVRDTRQLQCLDLAAK